MTIRRRILYSAIIFIMALVFTSANFFHTETDGRMDPRCPICQFQSSSIGVQHSGFTFVITTLAVYSIVERSVICLHDFSAPSTIQLRAPPLV